jgi:hypothetical protein
LELFTALFVIAIALLGAFVLWWVYGGWFFESSKFKILLPDSALAEPVLDSPEDNIIIYLKTSKIAAPSCSLW